MNRTWTFVAGASVLIVSALAGCSSSTNGNEASSGNTNSPNGPVTVTLMTWENPQTNQQIMSSLDKFMKENPNIKVKLMNAPLQSYGTKLNSIIAAHQAPDIVELGNDSEQQWGQQGLLYDYESLAKNDGNFLPNFVPAAVQSWTENGHLYGLPSLMNVYGVFFNKDDFKKAGLALPKPGWTYQEMLDDAQKLSGIQNGVHQYGLYDSPANGQYAFDSVFGLGVYSVSAGGAPFVQGLANTNKVTVSPQFMDGVHLFQKYIKSGAVTPPTWNNSQGESLFLQGKLPMWQAGQWNIEQMIGTNAPKNLNWGFAPSPNVNLQSTIFDSVGWASPKDIKNPDAVYKVLKYLDTTQYQQTEPGAPVAPPAYKPADDTYFSTLKSAGHQEAVDAIQYMLNSPNVQPVRFLETWANNATQFINADWNNVLNGQAPDSTVTDMARKISASINSAP